MAADPVGIGPVDLGAHVEGIGVVSALFAQGVEVVTQLWEQRVLVFQLERQAQGDIAGQQTEGLGSFDRIARRLGPQHFPPHGFQVIAENFPGAQQLLFVVLHDSWPAARAGTLPV